MKLLIILLVVCLTTSLGAMAQKPSWLSLKISSADTIMLASHDCLGCFDNGNDTPAPVLKLVMKGRPNYKALLKHKILTTRERVELSELLVRPFTDSVSITMHCCEPHHTLFLVKNNRTSYLDICFGCRCLNSSKDLAALYRLNNSQWPELDKFFTKLGLAYRE